MDDQHKHPLGATVTEGDTHESPQFDHLQDDVEVFPDQMTGVKALETIRGVRPVEFSVESDEAVIVKTTELSEEQEELAHVFDFST